MMITQADFKTLAPLFANLNVQRAGTTAGYHSQAPGNVVYGDSFTMQSVPMFGFRQPEVTGNGDHANITLEAGSEKGAFTLVNPKKQPIGEINMTGGDKTTTVNPYASKDGDYIWSTVTQNGHEYHLLIGAGGSVNAGGAKASMFADGQTSIAPLLPEAEALQAAALNERPQTQQNYVKTAFIPASSLGTRFQPILEALGDEGKPNAFLYGQTSILRRLVEHYKHFGIDNFIIGVPTSRKEEFAKNLEGTGVKIQLIAEDSPTGTAGIIGRMLNGEYPNIDFNPNEPLLVGMGDAVLKSGFDVGKLIQEHQETGADATLVAAQVPDEKIHKFGMVISETPNESSKVIGFKEKPKTDEQKAALGEHRLASTAIYVMNPKTIGKLKEKYQLLQEGKIEKYDHGFDFAGHLFEKELENLNIHVHKIDFDKWVDIGHLNTMNEVHRRIANGDVFGADETLQARAQIGEQGGIFYGGPNTKVNFKKDFPDAEIDGNVVVIQSK